MAKLPKTIQEQISLLKGRNMAFRDEISAPHFLANISYYRLKGYWWEMQEDKISHRFVTGSYFEDVIYLYNFDRHFRLIVFNAIDFPHTVSYFVSEQLYQPRTQYQNRAFRIV